MYAKEYHPKTQSSVIKNNTKNVVEEKITNPFRDIINSPKEKSTSIIAPEIEKGELLEDYSQSTGSTLGNTEDASEKHDNMCSAPF